MTRLIILGDELVAGTGDMRGLGWVGRAVARTEFTSETHVISLPVPHENTSDLAARWESEVMRRLGPDDEPLYAAVAMGVHDIPAGIAGARTRLNLANTLDGLYKLGARCMLVGPPPLPGVDSASIEALVKIGKEVAHRRNIPWVDTYTPLVNHEHWRAEFLEPGASYPGQSGYGLLTWVVLHEGWYEWLSA
ncbi:GDSL-type esterase/lipase family protein [Boudabousia marimammalium]|uniref:Lysophospholipase n=1 Tax=Boudabousia marimammalium TaxID=156892 RepID=A0A1Q5PRM9_9ACTO|nr:GDSL-type esterase/lipase family protein [Boudabousia marimammalium]OKL50183.1 lysophospholipase [Boudabousia marimammalium]